MQTIENFQRDESPMTQPGSLQPRLRMKFEKPVAFTFGGQPSETSPATSAPTHAESGVLRIVENRELATFRAEFAFELTGAVLGNVGNLISFRIGPSDAERLGPYTKPEFGSLDLQGLPNFHAAGRLLAAQGPSRPFVFVTHPATVPRGYRRAKPYEWELRERLFTRPVAEVESEIIRRRTAHKNDADSKGVGRANTADILCHRLFRN